VKRFYYFGCRGTRSGHHLYLGSRDGYVHNGHLDGGSPAYLLDGTFAPVDVDDRSWRLTHLRFDHHILSILARHDFTIDKRPGSNAVFVAIDFEPWDEEKILAVAKATFPDCVARLASVNAEDKSRGVT